MAFKALIVDKAGDGAVSQSITTIGEDRLPEADVTVAVEFSTLNYKDGLCPTGGGGLVRKYPHVPGIDFAGSVAKSDNAAYRSGDRVVLAGWARVARDLPMEKLESMVSEAILGDLPALGKAILKGRVKGRVLVDVNA